MNNNDKLKSLIQRLHNGESFEDVRKDFVANFADVSAEEIAHAEQKIIQEGTPVAEVKQLCDVHAALMRDNIQNQPLDIPQGHPAQILKFENAAFTKLIEDLQIKIDAGDVDAVIGGFRKLNAIYSHYGKKEDLCMPILYNHGVTGPSQVMWSVDDDIKLAIRSLNKKLTAETFGDLKQEMSAVLNDVEGMIFKEENIFIPLTLKFFTQDEWFAVYRDMQEYGYALIHDVPKWSDAEEWLANAVDDAETVSDDVIKFSTGELSIQQLKGILKLLPVDITFIDENDRVKFFVNEGKIFNRPKIALGNDVYNCHPPKILPMIRQMLADFKAKKRDVMEVTRMIKGKPVSVQYRAVYNDSGEYIGTVELVQDFSKPLEIFAKK